MVPLQLPESAQNTLLGVVTDGTGVDQDDMRLIRSFG